MWDFRYDPNDTGETAHWQENVTPTGWSKIQVPGSYDQALRNNVLYQGKAWHRTTFNLELKSGERALLRFDGVAIRSKVWVNGSLAGKHLFPYTGFEFDVTSLLKRGINRLVVLADNQLLQDAIPDLKCTGWWNYGGINRGVRLEIVPEIYAAGLRGSARMTASGWDFQVNANLINKGTAPADTQIQMSLVDRDGHTVWSYTGAKNLTAGENAHPGSRNAGQVCCVVSRIAGALPVEDRGSRG